MTQIGDNSVYNLYAAIPSPAPRRSFNTSSLSRRALSLSKGLAYLATAVLYYLLQISFFLATVTFNLLCNPIAWFLLKTSFNVLSEIFIYLVLGCCSLLISVITHFDEYYSKGMPVSKNALEKKLSLHAALDANFLDSIDQCSIRRFVEKPMDSTEF